MTRSVFRASMLCVAGLGLLASAGGSSAIAYRCENGQMPAPPEVAAQMALPLCGFAATKRWGPNGCQLCDPRNIYPNPYSGPNGARRGYGNRAYE